MQRRAKSDAPEAYDETDVLITSPASLEDTNVPANSNSSAHSSNKRGGASHKSGGVEIFKALDEVGLQSSLSVWEDSLSELADFCKIHGHCNVPQRYSKNTRLAYWVSNQRKQYHLHREGKESLISPTRIQELESLGFDWGIRTAAWEDRLRQLADYHKIHGHCNVPHNYSKTNKLSWWVSSQRTQYRLHQEGKKSLITLSRIQELESLGFRWKFHSATWEVRLNELADYRKIFGHCNVPANYSENTKLAAWVGTQRNQYRLREEGKASFMKLSRIQALESLGFEWSIYNAAWEDRFGELALYRKIHGHCNVPRKYSENTQLAYWVECQRTQYRLHLDGKKSFINISRIQALESLGFELMPKAKRKKRSLDDDATCDRKRAVEATEYTQQHSLKTSAVEKSAATKSTSLSNAKSPSGMAKSSSTSSRVESNNIKRVEARDARFDEMDLDGSLSDSSAAPSLYSDRWATKSLSPDTPDIVGGRMESNTRKDALQAKLPGLAHRKKRITSFSRALLAASPPENELLVATLKPANSRQSANSRLETAPCNDEILRITGYH
jgi:hypothetical protein